MGIKSSRRSARKCWLSSGGCEGERDALYQSLLLFACDELAPGGAVGRQNAVPLSQRLRGHEPEKATCEWRAPERDTEASGARVARMARVGPTNPS